MGGLANSPYSQSTLPPEIARVLNADVVPKGDDGTLLSVELAIPDMSPAERTLDLAVPAGELVVLRYVQRPGESLLDERIQMVGNPARIPRDKIIYNAPAPIPGIRRKRLGILPLDDARAAQMEQYREYHEGRIGRGLLGKGEQPRLAAEGEDLLAMREPIENLTVRRLTNPRAELLAGLALRRLNILLGILEVANLDYVRGMCDPATARERIIELYDSYGQEG